MPVHLTHSPSLGWVCVQATTLRPYERSGILRTTFPSFFTCSRNFSSTPEFAHRSGGVFFPVAQ